MEKYLQRLKDSWTKKGFFIEPVGNLSENSSSEAIVSEIMTYIEHNNGSSFEFISEEQPVQFRLDGVRYQAEITKPSVTSTGIGTPVLPVGSFIFCKEI